MGGKSQKAKIPRYNMSILEGICHAPIDAIIKFEVAEKEAWTGYATSNQVISIDKEGLFGGIKKEGGLKGKMELMLGGDSQLVSSELAERMEGTPANLPAMRGLVTAFLRGDGAPRGFYWAAQNAYLKNRRYLVQAIPRELSESYAEIPCGTITGTVGGVLPGTALWVAMDLSLAMDEEVLTGQGATRLDVMKDGVVKMLEAWAGITAEAGIDIVLVGQSQNYIQITKWAATGADIQELIDWVWAMDYDDVTQSTGFRPDSAIAGSYGFFNTSVAPRKILMTVSAGQYGSGTWFAASNFIDLIAAIHGDDFYAFAFNIDNEDLQYSIQSDRTPFDSVPNIGGGTADSLFIVLQRALAYSSWQDELVYSRLLCNPMHMIYQVYTNPVWGMKADPAQMDTAAFLSCAETLFNEDFGLSMKWTKSGPISDYVDVINDHINGVIFQSPATGLFTPRLIRDDYDPEALREINPDNAVLTTFSTKSPGEVVNEVTLTWTNPESNSEETVTRQDLGSIAEQGAVVSDGVNFFGIKCPDKADEICARELRARSALLSSGEAELDQSFWDITPYEPVMLNWPARGISGLVVRITEIDYGSPSDPTIRVSFMQDVYAAPAPTVSPHLGTSWVSPDQYPVPPSVGFFLPMPAYALVQEDLTLSDITYPDAFAGLLIASPFDSTVSASYSAAVSEVTATGDIVWVDAVEDQPFAGYGSLSETLLPGVSSIMSGPSGALGPVIQSGDLVLIGDHTGDLALMELSLVTAADPGTDSYTLLRGVLDTVPGEWPSGTPVWWLPLDRFDGLPDKYSDGQTISSLVAARTSKGVTSDAFRTPFYGTAGSRANLPLRPANVTINSVGFGAIVVDADTLDIAWSHRNRFLEDAIILGWDEAAMVIEPGVTYVIRIDAYDSSLALLEADWIDLDVGAVSSHSIDLTVEVPPVGTNLLRVFVYATSPEGDSWTAYSLDCVIDMLPPSDLTATNV